MKTAALLQRLRAPQFRLVILIAAALCIWRMLLYYTPLRKGSVPNRNVTFTGADFHGNYSNVSIAKHHGPFILTMNYGGQQGAGMRALVLQQCFVGNWDIPAYIVEPFVINSVLGHRRRHPNTKQATLKFSDLFDFENFNRESTKSGYAPLVEWEYFLNNAPNITILVELQSGDRKGTDTVWDVSDTQASPCYRGEQYPLNVVNTTICVVRIVKICCVLTEDHEHLSSSIAIATIEELQHGIFGKWKPEKVNIVFWYWTSFWHVPLTCGQGPLLIGKVLPSKQVLKHVHQYQEMFLKSSRTVAFVLRFEHLVFNNYNISTCLNKFHEAPNHFKKILTNASIFIAADVGKFKSNSWMGTYPLVVKVDNKSGEEVYRSFVNALSDFIGHYWNYDEWDNSFDQITDGIEDAGYVATLQKSIASMADCLVFLTKGESNFQNLVISEYNKQHPISHSERCIHYICTKDCQNCFHLYRKY